MAIIVSTLWFASEPDFYWFGLSEDDGVSNTPIEVTAASVVVAERNTGGNNWQAMVLDVAQIREDKWMIKTTVPALIANGQQRVIRVTIDGVVYGPWTFRFYPPT